MAPSANGVTMGSHTPENLVDASCMVVSFPVPGNARGPRPGDGRGPRRAPETLGQLVDHVSPGGRAITVAGRPLRDPSRLLPSARPITVDMRAAVCATAPAVSTRTRRRARCATLGALPAGPAD